MLLTMALALVASVGAQAFPLGLWAPKDAPAYEDVSVETGHQMWQDGLFVLDVRTTAEVAAGHLPGAYNIDVNELADRLGELAGRESDDILVYCLRGGRSAQAAGILADNGFTGVHNMLGGYEAWVAAGYDVTTNGVGYDEVGLEEAHELWRDGALAVDVRSTLDYLFGHIPGARLIRSFEVADRLEEIADWKDENILVYCARATCGQGATTCQLMADSGFTKVHLLTAGYEGWDEAGYEVDCGGCPGLPLACTPGTLAGPPAAGCNADLLVLALLLTALIGAGRLAQLRRVEA